MFCKEEIKYDLRGKTLLEQPKFSKNLQRLVAAVRSDAMDQNNGMLALLK